MAWSSEDLTNYNRAEKPWYSVHDNGKVDIGSKFEDDNKISLQPWGMYKLINDWLDKNHGLNEEEKGKLIKKLSK